ncbi:amino acid transporter, putative [Talaromyces stipitatus ATCC 10500]|uniref:Amino acid transporter, putative n=1 Tax=Talaromyces stipitatus (strain ATCC 10500 / CBS 375.48 / QM 6759 / NRRL 1006) TaxID=441959 RepID=B8MPI9_TALSN|nr:amino acid transporter, putative [Talaromyces stipitatus ATCC 10500]EED14428.1 amino acid transporter, putative [Talaromyces stipitatus ATCC 10500]
MDAIGLQTKTKVSTAREMEGKSTMDREERDRAHLLRLGKRPVLKRTYGFMAILGFTTTILVTWEGVLLVFNIGLENGGPAGMIYMYLFAWIGAWCTFASLCELASMAPISSGQYFWVAMLAPSSCQRFLSYLTGWMTSVGWQALVASTGYIAGTLIQTLVAITVPSYEATSWRGLLIIYAVLLFGFIINTIARRLLPTLEGPVLCIHILAFFGVLVPLCVLSSKRDASEVWAYFVNEGGWDTQGLSTMIGLLMSIFLFTGVDGAIHMSEEIKDAAVVVPRSIMASMGINGAFGFGILLAALYATTSIDDTLGSEAGEAGYPFLYVLQNGIGSLGGAVAMGAIIAVMQIFGNIADIAAASRMWWAFARDKAIPGWSFFLKLDSRTSLPVRCILFTVTVSVLLSLISIGSTTAFNDIVALVTSGYYSSYLMASGLLLYRRLTGAIVLPDVDDSPYEPVNNVGRRLVWGPWRIPGILGILINAFSVIYLTVALFWSFWPSFYPVTAESMNYNILIIGATLLLSIVYYIFHARKEYTGPIVETAPSDFVTQ